MGAVPVALDERFRSELEQQKIKYDILLQEKNDKEIESNEKLRQLEDRHQLKLQEVDTNYQKKLMAEVEKYRQLYNEKEEDGRKFRENVQDLVRPVPRLAGRKKMADRPLPCARCLVRVMHRTNCTRKWCTR